MRLKKVIFQPNPSTILEISSSVKYGYSSKKNCKKFSQFLKL